MTEAVDTRVNLGGIELRNPVLTASGTFGYGTEFSPFMDLGAIGGFVAKSLTLEPRSGNPPPRIAETPSGMLNAISIENIGVEAFLTERLAELPDDVVVIASCFGTNSGITPNWPPGCPSRPGSRVSRSMRPAPTLRVGGSSSVRIRRCSPIWLAGCGRLLRSPCSRNCPPT